MGMGDDIFSRSGNTSASGKLTDRIDVPVSENLKNELGFLAVAAGRPTSEYVRDILEAWCFGESHRVRKMVRLGLENGHGRNDG